MSKRVVSSTFCHFEFVKPAEDFGLGLIKIARRAQDFVNLLATPQRATGPLHSMQEIPRTAGGNFYKKAQAPATYMVWPPLTGIVSRCLISPHGPLR